MNVASMRRFRRLATLVGSFVYVACAAANPPTGALAREASAHDRRPATAKSSTARLRDAVPDPLRVPDSQLEPIDFSDLPDWADDDHARAFAAFRTSCRPIVRSQIPDPRPVGQALASVCRRALQAEWLPDDKARIFFEQNFRPMRIARLGDNAGFLTGYYEPVVEGSRFPTRAFTTPLYRRPPDLIAPDAPPGAGFPNRGRVMRVTRDGDLIPYYDRAEIEDGALDGQRLEICWIRTPADALNIQIQGSGRIRLEDGVMVRVNYDGHNGYPYTPVGRILIERNIIPREEMSMARILEWMTANPDGAREVRRQNRSYVFFRVAGLTEDREPVGGQGVELTPGRSIAVDRLLHAYGTPFFIDANLPLGGPRAADPFRRTMIAQDTGSAIVGPARADLYFGAGDEAGRVAGRIKQSGRFAMLVPREIDPVAQGARMPLPLARPALKPEKPGVAGRRENRRIAPAVTRTLR